MATLTVYTKLLDKTLDGGRIIDFGSTKSCECYVIPRDKSTDICKKHSRLQQYGFYMLLGHDKNMKPMVYVGQTNDFTNRVNDHKQKKDWWDTALVFVSKLSGIYASEANCSEQRQGFLPVKRDRNACQKGAFCTAIVT